MIRIFMAIAQKPMSFSDLHKKLKLSYPVLTDHLQHLERNLAIYRHIINVGETPDPKEVGKVVYKAKIDQIPTMLRQSLFILDTITEVLEDEQLKKDLEPHIRAISEAIVNYLNDHAKTREQGLESERKSLEQSKVKTDES